MAIVIVCSLLALVGLVLIVAWGGMDVQAPAPEQDSAGSFRTRAPRALRRYAWWATVATVAGAASGILLAGAGGRVVMRVLALTSPLATGRLTEAQALVGDITLNGTMLLLVFGALPGAFLSSLLYLLIHRWLPRGRLGGLVFGLLLLLLLAPFLEPLRAGNPDFDILTPGWLSVLLFSVLVVLHGMLVAAIAGWYSRHLPLRPGRPWLAYSPLLAAVAFVPAGMVAAAGAVLVLLGTALVPSLARRWSTPAVAWTGRAMIAVLLVLALPVFAESVGSIITR